MSVEEVLGVLSSSVNTIFIDFLETRTLYAPDDAERAAFAQKICKNSKIKDIEIFEGTGCKEPRNPMKFDAVHEPKVQELIDVYNSEIEKAQVDCGTEYFGGLKQVSFEWNRCLDIPDKEGHQVMFISVNTGIRALSSAIALTAFALASQLY